MNGIIGEHGLGDVMFVIHVSWFILNYTFSEHSPAMPVLNVSAQALVSFVCTIGS
jgi:hypothetical protein